MTYTATKKYVLNNHHTLSITKASVVLPVKVTRFQTKCKKKSKLKVQVLYKSQLIHLTYLTF